MALRVVQGLTKAKEELARRRQSALEGQWPKADRSEELFGEKLSPPQVVARILDDVRHRGDAAVKHYTRLLDRVDLERLEVPREEVVKAKRQVPQPLAEALTLAAQRVRTFQQQSLPRTWLDLGQGLGELVTAVERVGIYAPGGTASYPSTVLMTAIPARVAGVSQVILATPAGRKGQINPAVLFAAELAEVDRVFQIGGVQAIGALAYGTESVPKVDKICGPGNIYTTLAKKMVFGDVDIDGLYGPTETLLVADDSASPTECAADLLAQAEHDPLASPILITTSQALAAQVQEELERQLAGLERRDLVRASLDGQGCVILVDSIEEALELANLQAPEHLCLLVRDPWAWIGKVRHAGGVFLGSSSPEVMGDYVAGPSHVMPTSGTARYASALSVHHFLKRVPVVGMSAEEFRKLAPVVSTIARAEGLTAHARAVEVRLERMRDGKEGSGAG